MNTLEHLLVPFEFRMIGKWEITLPVYDSKKPDDVPPPLVIGMNPTPTEILCVRWSERPDIVAGSFRLHSDSTNVSEASERATEALRGMYRARDIPWPGE